MARAWRLAVGPASTRTLGVATTPTVPYQVLANAVLLLHFAVVIFVVLGLPAVLVGNWRGWVWANHFWWRVVHLLAIGIVVLQAWLGRYCGLTALESKLRGMAGQVGYERSFVEYWVQRLLYYEGPLWAFALVYTVFGALVGSLRVSW